MILKFAFGPKKLPAFEKRAPVQGNIRCLIANRNRTISGKELFFMPFKARDILFSIVYFVCKISHRCDHLENVDSVGGFPNPIQNK